MAGLSRVRRHGGVPVSAGAAAEGERGVLQPAGTDELDRGDRRHPPQPAQLLAAVVAVRGGAVPLLARRRLYLQLPQVHPPRRSPVPLDRRRDLPDGVPRADAGAAAARAQAQPAAQPQHADRRGDPDARAVAALVGAADRAVLARRHDEPAAQARVGGLPARGHRPARGGDPPDTRQRAAATVVLPVVRKRRLAAGDGLRLRSDDARQRLSPPAAARPRLVLLSGAVGRRRAAPLDGRAAGASGSA